MLEVARWFGVGGGVAIILVSSIAVGMTFGVKKVEQEGVAG